MSEVLLLSAAEQGAPQAASQLLPLVYDEVRILAARKLAHEPHGRTPQPTALVNEAYLKLVGGQEKPPGA
jgi:ECF sigma factor